MTTMLLMLLGLIGLLMTPPLGFADTPGDAGGGDAGGDGDGGGDGGGGAGDSGGGDAAGAGAGNAGGADAAELSEADALWGQLSPGQRQMVIDDAVEAEQRRRAAAEKPAAEKPNGDGGDGDSAALKRVEQLEKQMADRDKKTQDTATLKRWVGGIDKTIAESEYTRENPDAEFIRRCAVGVAAVSRASNAGAATEKFIKEFEAVVARAAQPLAEKQLEQFKKDFVAGKVRAKTETPGEAPGGGAPAGKEGGPKAGDLKSGKLKRQVRDKYL